MDSTKIDRWYFTREELENSPTRRCGLDAEKELSLRQQSANFIQDMGQRLQVSQLCINTGIVYMHRFYCFHSFTKFSRTNMAAASIFLAAKVEEQPRKLEHIIKVKLMCLSKTNVVIDRHSELYLQQAQELVMNENILLMTLGFDVAIEHPHAFIVKFCHIANASKDLSQTSYFMASNSLHLTTMCLQYKPTVVACVCIHLSCQWSRWQIPKSKENLPWYTYIDPTVTEELLEQLTNEFLAVFDKCPSRLLKKKQVGQNGQQNAMTVQDGQHQYHQPLQPASSSCYYSSSSSSAKPGASSSSSSSSSAPAPVVNGSKSHQSSSSSLGDTATHKLPKSSSSVMPPQHVKSGSGHSVPPHSGRPPSSSSSSQQQQHAPKPLHPHGVPASSVMKPYPPLTGPSNIGGKHPTDSTAHHVFTRDASGQRMEQKPSTAVDVKHRPGPSSAPPSSLAVNNHHQANRPSNVFPENHYRKENTSLPLVPLANPIPASRTASFTSTSDHDIIQHVVKEVASKQEEKQRLSSTLKIEPKTEPFDAAPSTSYQSMSASSARNPSIFSPPYFPSPTFGSLEDSVKTSPPMLKVVVERSPDLEDPRLSKRSTSSGEKELILIKKESMEFEEFDMTSPKGESRDDESSANDMSHSHKKKKKHKEKEKKHDKEKHRHKDKKRHKEDKYKKEHKEKRSSKEHDGASTSDAVPERNPGSSIKITIPKEKLKDIPKLKISLNNQVVTPAVSDAEENIRLKISKDKIKSSRKRHRDSSDSAGPSKKHNGSGSHNGY